MLVLIYLNNIQNNQFRILKLLESTTTHAKVSNSYINSFGHDTTIIKNK